MSTRFQRFRWWLFDDAPGWLSDSKIGDWLLRVVCLISGHRPTADHCNRPEHDFCAYCMKPMPNQARRDEQGRLIP